MGIFNRNKQPSLTEDITSLKNLADEAFSLSTMVEAGELQTLLQSIAEDLTYSSATVKPSALEKERKIKNKLGDLKIVLSNFSKSKKICLEISSLIKQREVLI